MPWPRPEYTRLTRSARLPLIFSAEMYLGDDHLLQVTHCMGVDKFHRFYFRDIVAADAVETPLRLIVPAILGGLGFFTFLLALIPIDLSWHLFWGILTLILVGFGVTYFLKGPTVRMRLATTLQRTRLWGVSRKAHAEKLFEVLDEKRQANTVASG